LEFGDGVRKSNETYGAIDVAVKLLKLGDGVSNALPFVSDMVIMYEL
jgi:hypothetical protein